MNKEKMINELVINCCFKCEDAKEIFEKIILKRYNIEDIRDVTGLYEVYGARWEDEELVNYVNEDSEVKLSLEEILSWECMYKLPSGLIISWGY